LISSGGLGREVSPLLRAAVLPGASTLLSAATATPGRRGRRDGQGNARPQPLQGIYVEALARALRPLQERGSRRAFMETLRAVVDVQGQRVIAVIASICSPTCRP
jgi:hypothetical protein